mgnify:CR=1 FL=1
MKNVYLSQMSLELPGSKYYYFPYSVGVVWSYADAIPILHENYQLKGLYFVKEDIDNIVNNKIYFSKNTYLWKSLNKNKNNKYINFCKYEERKKI